MGWAIPGDAVAGAARQAYDPRPMPAGDRTFRTIGEERPAEGLRVAIVVSRYNGWITSRLEEGALAEFERLGGRREDAVIVPAPGAFELPVLARAAAEGRDAVVALGCLIRGETRHDRVIADAVAGGLVRVSIETGVAVGFGVLTVDSAKQAEARATAVGDLAEADETGRRGKRPVSNKGVEAMAAAVQTARALHRLRAEAPLGADAVLRGGNGRA